MRRWCVGRGVPELWPRVSRITRESGFIMKYVVKSWFSYSMDEIDENGEEIRYGLCVPSPVVFEDYAAASKYALQHGALYRTAEGMLRLALYYQGVAPLAIMDALNSLRLERTTFRAPRGE